jgi:hypothetical protein
MRYLPTDDEAEWLLQALAALIRACGAEQFLKAPIVEPASEYFPDRVDSPEAALDRITRRLMQYAGLGDLEVGISYFEEDSGRSPGTPGWGTAGLFIGIEGACCKFGINASMIEQDMSYVAGVMAHEVAHAYRQRHQLRSADPEEELLTDLTATYLGFGILAANNSYRFRKSGRIVGGSSVTSWSTSTAGYLPPQAHTFLLGCQVVARGLDDGDRRVLLDSLEANQSAFLDAAIRHFEDQPAGSLQNRLGLPDDTTGPVQIPVDVLRPLSPHVGGDARWREWAKQRKLVNRGRPIFRIRRTRTAAYCAIAAGALGPGAAIVALECDYPGATLIGAGLVFAFVGVLAGIVLGRRGAHDVCSDQQCEAFLAPELTRCPHCGGDIRGRIRHADERLAAEDRIRAEDANARRQRQGARTPDRTGSL